MVDFIRYIPAIKKLHLINVGVWKDVTLEFSGGVNIITGANGTGKSTILNSILPTSNHRVSPHYKCNSGKIEAEFTEMKLSYKLLPRKYTLNDEKKMSGAQKMLNLLSEYLKRSGDGCGLLIESELMGRLDQKYYLEATRMINDAKCQIIVVNHTLREPNCFQKAKIFECIYDIESQSSHILTKDLRE